MKWKTEIIKQGKVLLETEIKNITVLEIWLTYSAIAARVSVRGLLRTVLFPCIVSSLDVTDLERQLKYLQID